MKSNLLKVGGVVLIGLFLVASNSYAAEQVKMKSQSPAPAYKIGGAPAQQKANQSSPGLKQKTLLGTPQPDKTNKVITQKYAAVVKKASGYIKKVDFGFMKFSNKTIKAKPVDKEELKGECLKIAVDCWIKLANDSATLDVLEKGVNDCAVKEKDGCDDYPLCDGKEQKLAGIILWSDPEDIPNKQTLEWGLHCEKKNGVFHAEAKCLDLTYPYSEHIEYYDGFAPQIYGCKDGEWWGINMSFGLHGAYGNILEVPTEGLTQLEQ